MTKRIAPASMLLALAAATASAQTDFYLHLLHHNDGESQLIDAGSGLEDFGGVARFATVVADLRAEAMRPTVAATSLITARARLSPTPSSISSASPTRTRASHSASTDT